MPRKKSTATKQLTGTYDPRTKESLTYPTPTPAELRAPSHLGKHGKALWKRITSLEPSILQVVDLPLIGSFCGAFDGFMQARASLKRDGYTLTARAETKTGFSERQYRHPAVDLEIKYASLMAQLGAKAGYSPRDREMLTEQAAPVRRYSTTAATKAPKKISEMTTEEAIKAFNI